MKRDLTCDPVISVYKTEQLGRRGSCVQTLGEDFSETVEEYLEIIGHLGAGPLN